MESTPSKRLAVTGGANGAGSAPLIEMLRDNIRQEWHQFRKGLDDAASEHFRGQELLLTRCLQEASSCGRSQEGLLSRCLQEASTASAAEKTTAPSLSDGMPPDQEDLWAEFRTLQASTRRMEALLLQQSKSQGQAVDMCRVAPVAIEVEVEDSQTAARSSLANGALRKATSKDSISKDSMDSGTTTSGLSQNHSRSKIGTKISFSELASQNSPWKPEASATHRRLRSIFSGCMDWWMSLQEPPRTGRLADIVNGKKFETLCASVIIVNAAMSCVRVNHEASTRDPEPTPFMQVAEYLFVSFYTMEMILKLIVHRFYYFCNEDMRWNIFDGSLVIFSIFDLAITLMVASSGEEGGGNFTFMRTLRLLKMARVLRGLRVMRFFSELRLMLNSLIGSVSSLMWSIAMLGLIFYIFGLIFVQGVSNFLIDSTEEEIDNWRVEELVRNFGLVQRTILSLFMTCSGGDDWRNFYEALSPVGVEYKALYLFFVAFSHIALMNILTAIFVQRAMKLAEPDRETQAMQLRSDEIAEYEELRQIMHDADRNASGTLSKQEFCNQVHLGKLGAKLNVLGLHIKDPASFFRLACEGADHGKEIDIDNFIERCMHMRGYASCIEVEALSHDLKALQELQRQSQRDAWAFQAAIERRIDEMIMLTVNSVDMAI